MMLLSMRLSSSKLGNGYCAGRVPEKACPARSRTSRLASPAAAFKTSCMCPAQGKIPVGTPNFHSPRTLMMSQNTPSASWSVRTPVLTVSAATSGPCFCGGGTNVVKASLHDVSH